MSHCSCHIIIIILNHFNNWHWYHYYQQIGHHFWKFWQVRNLRLPFHVVWRRGWRYYFTNKVVDNKSVNLKSTSELHLADPWYYSRRTIDTQENITGPQKWLIKICNWKLYRASRSLNHVERLGSLSISIPYQRLLFRGMDSGLDRRHLRRKHSNIYNYCIIW